MSIGIIVYCYDRPQHLNRLLLTIDTNLIGHLYLVQDGLGDSSRKSEHEAVTEIIKDYSSKNGNVKQLKEIMESRYGDRSWYSKYTCGVKG